MKSKSRTLSAFFAAFALCFATTSYGQSNPKPLTDDDVIKMAKAGLENSIIIATISHSQTAFDTTPDALINLSKSGVAGPVINAMLNVSADATPNKPKPIPAGSEPECPSRSGVYFKRGIEWVALNQAASAGSQVKPVFGGAKSMVVYMGAEAPEFTPASPTFCFREIKPDLGITVVRLEKKKDHRELQTSLYSGFLTPGIGNGIKMKDIIHVSVRPVENEEDVTIVKVLDPLPEGQYLVLSQNPLFASMPASVPMSMRVGIGYDFGIR